MPSPFLAEAAESDAEGITQMVGGGLGIVLGVVGRERCVFGTVDSGLGPGLDATPTGRPRAAKFDRGLTVGFVDSACRVEMCNDCV